MLIVTERHKAVGSKSSLFRVVRQARVNNGQTTAEEGRQDSRSGTQAGDQGRQQTRQGPGTRQETNTENKARKQGKNARVKMSSVMVMVLVLVSLFIPAVRPSEGLWKLECQPTVGIVAQTTVISCLSKGNENVKIVAISLTKSPEKKPFLQINLNQKKTSGDQRFSLKNPALDPSLQISDTMFSDEGEYLYRVITNRGEQKAQLSISITAKYNNPITSTWPEDVTNGGSVDLYCNATDGYPAGFIHWFDRSGANWTKTSHLTKANKDSNGLKSVALSSKLTFKSIDLDAVAPFRCIVLNSKYSQDGESTLRIKSAIRDHIEEPSVSNTTHIVAGVLVIGSLIVGILCALLCFRKRNVQRYESGRTDDDDDQETGNISN